MANTQSSFKTSEANAPATVNEIAGNLPIFPAQPGEKLATSLALGDFRTKRMLFNRLNTPGEVHVYSAECVAGERLHVRSLIPELPHGGAVVPTFAIVAQSLPYSADVRKLPIELPGGFSAVVAAPQTELGRPIREMATGVRYYPGPAIETRTLVGGRCYLLVWSAGNNMGKYAMQLGTRPNSVATFWTQFPLAWWQVRGWFGASRAAAIYAVGAILAGVATLGLLFRKVKR
jgi:hypothetical protein